MVASPEPAGRQRRSGADPAAAARLMLPAAGVRAGTSIVEGRLKLVGDWLDLAHAQRRRL
ncbi:MAG: hypothetical protein ACKPBV_03325 [Sphaerospermopsis kisseleviana]